LPSLNAVKKISSSKIRTSSSSSSSLVLFAAAPNRKSSYFREPAQIKVPQKTADEDKVVGTDFFGGAKLKDDLFDPVLEATATVELKKTRYIKWEDRNAFVDDVSRALAKSLQGQLNGLLYAEDESPAQPEYVYSKQLQWSSPLISGDDKEGASTTPFEELSKGLEFYRRLDVAITSGRSLSSTVVELRWEISVAWPNSWESRVLITGKSILTLSDQKEIMKQVDIPDDEDISASILAQVTPRFWDAYHLGMGPSAELSPLIAKRNGGGLFSRYTLCKVPPRLVYQPTLLDVGGREDAAAELVPNHSFCDYIKTTGPYKQRYVATSPVELQIVRSKELPNTPRLKFSLPLSVEVQTNPTMPLPGDDPETFAEADADVEYVWQTERTVATVPYGGSPQDEEVTGLRKKLYEAVIKDGYQPKLDVSGRPIFFFWSNNIKACYTPETGLGMCIYEYRLKAANGNCVGIELEESGSLITKKTMEKSSLTTI